MKHTWFCSNKANQSPTTKRTFFHQILSFRSTTVPSSSPNHILKSTPALMFWDQLTTPIKVSTHGPISLLLNCLHCYARTFTHPTTTRMSLPPTTSINLKADVLTARHTAETEAECEVQPKTRARSRKMNQLSGASTSVRTIF